LEKPNIGLLSKESLEDVRKTRLKNLPIELLERLMRDDTPEEPDHLLQEKRYSGRPLPPGASPTNYRSSRERIRSASQPIHISSQSTRGISPGGASSAVTHQSVQVTPPRPIPFPSLRAAAE
jgi:hypothetical protein